MANDINVVVLVGRLTRDCEVRATAGGTSVCRFSVAVNRRKKTGEAWSDEVNYFDVVLWGKSADSLKTYLTKGRQVSIEGELRQNRWEQDGQARTKVEIYANNVQLLSSPTGADMPQTSANQASSAESGNFVPSQDFGPEAFEDKDADIPF